MLYWLIKAIAGPIVLALFRPRVQGAANVPAQGGAILASNHLSFSDSIFLPLVLKRRLTFPAKMEYFTGTGLKGRLTAAFFRSVGQIPIDRSGGGASERAMGSALEILERGDLFGIYPEGTRSPDGRLYRGKTGMARLALDAGVPIIPVAMIDTDKAQPTGQKLPRLIQVGVRIGKPMDYRHLADRRDDREVLRQITNEVMAALADLSGQEYVDEYAADRKKALAERAEQLLTLARAQADAAAARAKAEAAAATARARAEALNAANRARAQADEYAERARAEYAAAMERATEAAGRARGQVDGAIGKTRAQADDALTRARAKAMTSAAEGAARAEGFFAQAKADSAARANEFHDKVRSLDAQRAADEAQKAARAEDEEIASAHDDQLAHASAAVTEATGAADASGEPPVGDGPATDSAEVIDLAGAGTRRAGAAPAERRDAAPGRDGHDDGGVELRIPAP